MKRKQLSKILALPAVLLSVLLVMTGCVVHPDSLESSSASSHVFKNTEGNSSSAGVSAATESSQLSGGSSAAASSGTASAFVEEILAKADADEQAAVAAAKKKVAELEGEPRIIATTPAVAQICDLLDLDLVGVCEQSTTEIPERYQSLTRVGTAMSPDMEIVSSLSPDWILSPVSLISDLKPKYEEIDSEYAFLNLSSVEGMLISVVELGEIFDKEDEAEAFLEDFETFYQEFQKTWEGQEAPKVLILMGMPGSYVVATENSYIGSLVKMAGGENVYSGYDEDFISANTEDMKTKEPDVILRAAHALPEDVKEMFAEEFKENDIWQHFDAVKQDRVYDLTYGLCGMSANLQYQEALEEVASCLYQTK